MARSNSESIDKLEADQALMRDKLEEQGKKLDEQGVQLSEIAAITEMLAGKGIGVAGGDGVGVRGNGLERLSTVRQTGSVEEYVSLFSELASHVTGLEEDHYLDYFISGLKDTIRRTLSRHRPKDLETAMEWARHVQDSQRAKELEELRAIGGFCHKCKRHYSSGHDCPLQQLRALMAKIDLRMKVTGQDLPIYSMTSPGTMTLRGEVQNQSVTVAIVSGATHNFICSTLVSSLNLKPHKTGRFEVKLGDGRRQASEGVCRQLCIALPGYEAITDCYVFPLGGGVSIILGIAWLATLGQVIMNWKDLSMKFEWCGEKVELRGDPALCRNMASLLSIEKAN